MLNTEERRIIEALWQMYYHNEFQDLEQIDGNDHPRLKKLAEDLTRRLGHEFLIIESRTV